MSVSDIPEKTRVRLWVLSGGRCQYDGCNIPLWRDDLTMLAMNRSYIAHIIADSPEGPRGDPILSPKLATEITNLMLMCDTHHRLIDKEQVREHPVDRLHQMKHRHEERVELATAVREEKTSEVLLYQANIGGKYPRVTFDQAAYAMAPDKYPANPRAIELGMVNSSFEDSSATFWQVEQENLCRLFADQVKPRLATRTMPHLSVLGFAPQPLLMLLGHLLSDIPAADIYQLHREPQDWRWQQHPAGFDYSVVRPATIAGPPALVFSLSATITTDRVQAVAGGPFSLWTVTIPAPNNDFLKSREQLQMFRQLMRPLLNEIKTRHGQDAVLHVFPAMPIATAMEFGRVIMPKADLTMRIYDQNRATNGFALALNIDA